MNPITRTKVTIDTAGAKVISWNLTEGYNNGAPIEFYIDWARSGGDWTEVAGPLTDVCTYTDAPRYNWNKDRDLYYRLRFTDNAGQEHVGQPAKAGDGFLNKHDWLIFREILRKECLLLSKYTGMPGEFLRRKHWGVKCPICLDYDTEEVVDGNCAACLGTRFVGGYYESIAMNVMEQKHPVTDKKTEATGSLGTMDDQSITVRALAFPMQDSMDLWTNTANNDRYIIRKITPIVSFKGIIISVLMDLQKSPYTDIVYDAPVDISSQTDNITPGLDNGWRGNLDDEY